MASLVQPGKYGAIKSTDTETMDFMLSCSNHKHIHYKIEQQLTNKL